MRNLLTMNSRMFSAGFNYSVAGNPKVFMNVSKDGNAAGKLVFELYENHAPNLATNFAAFCAGTASAHRGFAGSSLCGGTTGLGVHGGHLEGKSMKNGGENLGHNDERLQDENLHLRHHKRGIVSMTNDGPHSNGSQFMVTFGEAHYLDGY